MEGAGYTMATSFSRQYEVGGFYDTFTTLNITSTAFTDLGTIDCRSAKSKHIRLTAASTDLTYKVLGSIDGGSNYDITVLSSAALAAAASTNFLVTDYYTNLKIQGAYGSTTGTSTGTLAGKFATVNL